MAIIDYADGISRDTNVLGENVYYDNGQGCGTIWFKNVKQARKFIAKHGRIDGRDSGLCKKCQCHYSKGTHGWTIYKQWVCHKWIASLKFRTIFPARS